MDTHRRQTHEPAHFDRRERQREEKSSRVRKRQMCAHGCALLRAHTHTRKGALCASHFLRARAHTPTHAHKHTRKEGPGGDVASESQFLCPHARAQKTPVGGGGARTHARTRTGSEVSAGRKYRLSHFGLPTSTRLGCRVFPFRPGGIFPKLRRCRQAESLRRHFGLPVLLSGGRPPFWVVSHSARS